MDPDALAPLPAGRAATLIADGTLSPVDLLEACLARAGAAVEDVKLPAPFAACREMIAAFRGRARELAAERRSRRARGARVVRARARLHALAIDVTEQALRKQRAR